MSSIEELLEELHFLGYRAEYNWKTMQLLVVYGELYMMFKVAPHTFSDVYTDEAHFEQVLELVQNYFQKGGMTTNEPVSQNYRHGLRRNAV